MTEIRVQCCLQPMSIMVYKVSLKVHATKECKFEQRSLGPIEKC